MNARKPEAIAKGAFFAIAKMTITKNTKTKTLIMDEIKLTKWRRQFTENAKLLQIPSNAVFSNDQLEKAVTLKLDASDEWELVIQEDLPDQIKRRLQEIFLASKPEDSI